MKRLLAVLVPLLLTACSSSSRIPEHQVEVGSGDPVSIDLVSFDPAGLTMDTRNMPQIARLKVRVSNSSRDDLHVVRVHVIQDAFSSVKLEPAMNTFDVTIRPGDAHVFELSMYGVAEDPTRSVNADLGLRIDVYTPEGDDYFTTVHFPLSAPPRER